MTKPTLQGKKYKRGCNQCGKPIKECGHKTLEELITKKDTVGKG